MLKRYLIPHSHIYRWEFFNLENAEVHKLIEEGRGQRNVVPWSIFREWGKDLMKIDQPFHDHCL